MFLVAFNPLLCGKSKDGERKERGSCFCIIIIIIFILFSPRKELVFVRFYPQRTMTVVSGRLSFQEQRQKQIKQARKLRLDNFAPPQNQGKIRQFQESYHTGNRFTLMQSREGPNSFGVYYRTGLTKDERCLKTDSNLDMSVYKRVLMQNVYCQVV